MKIALSLFGALAALTLAFALGFHLRGGAVEPAAEPPPAAEREVLYWYDPMVPDTHFDAPGKSPFMDMQLVPKYADAGDPATARESDTTVRIDPRTLQNLGVRTMAVERGRLESSVRVPGSVQWDARQEHQVSARAAGVIETLHVRAPFEPVRKGQPLITLVAPEWSAAIAEYHALAESRSDAARELRAAARQRLRALGIGDAQVRQSVAGGGAAVVLRAPTDGVIGALEVREGQQVASGTPLMTVNGLDTVWVEAALPQAQAGEIGPGSAVEVTVSAFPGESFEGTVEALLPSVDAATRTQAARIVLENPQQRLVPGMFAEVAFTGDGGAPLPLVPDDALIATGSDARVILAEGGGRFRPQRVLAGRSGGGRTEILSGLEGGEQVVVSGQFLIDSEASLSGALERLAPPAAYQDAAPAAPSSQHQHAPTEQPEPPHEEPAPASGHEPAAAEPRW